MKILICVNYKKKMLLKMNEGFLIYVWIPWTVESATLVFHGYDTIIDIAVGNFFTPLQEAQSRYEKSQQKHWSICNAWY